MVARPVVARTVAPVCKLCVSAVGFPHFASFERLLTSLTETERRRSPGFHRATATIVILPMSVEDQAGI